MILRLSESYHGVTVELTVEVCPASLQLPLSNPSPALKSDELESELLDRAMDQAHNQLPPLLRRARLLVEASLVEMVSCDMRASLPKLPTAEK